MQAEHKVYNVVREKGRASKQIIYNAPEFFSLRTIHTKRVDASEKTEKRHCLKALQRTSRCFTEYGTGSVCHQNRCLPQHNCSEQEGGYRCLRRGILPLSPAKYDKTSLPTVPIYTSLSRAVRSKNIPVSKTFQDIKLVWGRTIRKAVMDSQKGTLHGYLTG